MANILVFEDCGDTIYDIHQALQNTPHEIVGEAVSMDHAQQYLGRLLSNEIEVDVLLLDGNLSKINRSAEFRHVFPLDGTEPVRKGRFGRLKAPTPREIIIDNIECGLGGDARMIQKILTACELTVPIIGISADSMFQNGVEVAVDLGKRGLKSGLVPAIESILHR